MIPESASDSDVSEADPDVNPPDDILTILDAAATDDDVPFRSISIPSGLRETTEYPDDDLHEVWEESLPLLELSGGTSS